MKKHSAVIKRIWAKRPRFKRSYLAIPNGVFMLVFTIVPMVLILLYAFTKNDGAGRLTFEFTGENFVNSFNSNNIGVLWNSLWMGLAGTAICLAIGYPAAYFLATAKYNTSPILVTLFMLPMWTDFVLRSLATKAVLEAIDIRLGVGAVLFGMVYNFLPFMILPVYTSIKKIDNSLLEAAADLGCTEFKTLRKVVLPLSLPGVLSGFTMVFVPSITTFVISDMMSNKIVTLIGKQIYFQFNNTHFGTGSALSLIVLVFILLTMLIVQKVQKEDKTAGGKLW